MLIHAYTKKSGQETGKSHLCALLAVHNAVGEFNFYFYISVKLYVNVKIEKTFFFDPNYYKILSVCDSFVISSLTILYSVSNSRISSNPC